MRKCMKSASQDWTRNIVAFSLAAVVGVTWGCGGGMEETPAPETTAPEEATPPPEPAASGGVTVEGWEVRLDQGTDPADVLSFRTMGSGLHATTGGSGTAIFWQSDSMHKEDYTISASFTQVQPSSHPNAYGLIFGGSDLAGPDQRYSYFVVREDGQFLIKKRMGSEVPTVVDWTPHAAINALDAEGRAMNTLAVEVGSDQVRFLVNGTEVTTQPRSAVDTDGITGLRVNHELDVHIGDLKLGM